MFYPVLTHKSYIVLAFFVYILIGMFSFRAIEGPQELIRCNKSRSAINDMRNGFTMNNNGKIELSREELLEVVKMAEEYSSNGVPISILHDIKNPCPTLWTFGGAIYFVMTAVTTVGYGDTAPKTVEGRILFIFYVIPGIVLCGAFLGQISGFLSSFRRKIKKKFRNLPTFLNVVIILLFAIGLFICIPAMIICLAAGWTYFEAFYFMIVTFTTVGFGDYSIAEYDWKFGIVFFIYLGLAWLGSIIGAIQEKFENRLENKEEND